MAPFVARLIDERADLMDRLGKLRRFTDSHRFLGLQRVERDLMFRQLVAMTEYEAVLNERIACYADQIIPA